MRIILLLLSLFFVQNLFAYEYAIYAQKGLDTPIKKFSIFSERCSGSNYTHALIRNNIEIKPVRFAHKHFPPWLMLPQEEWLGNSRLYTFEKTDDHLFVVLFRNPYDWLRSFHLKPWGNQGYRRFSFSEFIRTPWELDSKSLEYREEHKRNPLVDLDPRTRASFENVMTLRSTKIENYLLIKDKAKNVYYLNYETVRDYPEEVLEEIATLYDLEKNPVFSPVDTYKGFRKTGKYQEIKYEPISLEDLQFINSQLDEDLENQVGYELNEG